MLCIFSCFQAFAGPIPDHSKLPKKPELLPPQIDVHPDPKTEKPAQATGVDVREYLSGVVYYATVKNNKPQQSLDIFQTEIQPDMTASETVAATSSILGSCNASNDTYQDVEPSIISIDRNGTTWTSSVYIKYVNGIGSNHYSTTWDFANFNRGQLPLPADYTWSGDPLLAQNPYSYGIAPGRIYASGIIFNGSSNITPNGIALWRSDAVGWSWYPPTIVASNLSDSNIFLDKPAVAVSWHSGADLGYVYVAWISSDSANNVNSLYVAKSTDGGAKFGDPKLVSSGGTIQ